MARWSSSRFLLLLAILFDATSSQYSQSRVDFDAEPTDFYPTIGQNVSLRCEIASTKTITWNSSAFAAKSTESPLFVRKFNESYEGDYFCVANFENGERIRSRSAKLRTRVIIEGPKLGKYSETFHPSETITAWTIASGISNQFRVEWILQCQSSECRVATDDACRDVATHQSQLNSSATYAALRIRLVSSNIFTTCRSKVRIRARVDPSSAFAVSTPSVQYRVSDPGALYPVLQLAPIDTSVELGHSATLYCVANEADGVYAYAWDRDGVRLPLSGVEAKWSLVQDGILRIDNVSRADAGVYRCNVSGRHEWTPSARLSVYEKPRVEIRVNVVSRALLSVSCRHETVPPGSVSILFNGAIRKIVSTTTTNGDVEAELLLTTSGIVQCLVENQYGSSQDALNVTMETVVPDNDPKTDSIPTSTTSLDVLTEKTTTFPSTTLRIGEVENSPNKMIPIVVGSIVSVAVLIIVVVIIILLLNRRKQPKETQIVVKVNPFAGEKTKDGGATNQTGTGGSRSNDYGSFQRVAIDDPDADDLAYAKIEMMPLPRESDVDDGASEASSAYAVVGNVYPATKAKKSPPIPKPYRRKPPIPSPYTPKGEKTKNCGLKLEHYVVGDDAYAMLQKSPSRTDDSDKDSNLKLDYYFVGDDEYAVSRRKEESGNDEDV